MGKSMPCTKLDSDTIGSVPGCHGCALAAGAAVAFGLMGMAEAIRKNDHRGQIIEALERTQRTWEQIHATRERGEE